MNNNTKYYIITVLSVAYIIYSGVHYHNLRQEEECEKERAQGIQDNECDKRYPASHSSNYGSSTLSNNKNSNIDEPAEASSESSSNEAKNYYDSNTGYYGDTPQQASVNADSNTSGSSGSYEGSNTSGSSGSNNESISNNDRNYYHSNHNYYGIMPLPRGSGYGKPSSLSGSKSFGISKSSSSSSGVVSRGGFGSFGHSFSAHS